MIAAVWSWAAALAADVVGAPADALAALGGLAVGACILIGWGAVTEVQVRASQRRAKTAQRLSRCLFAARALRRWKRR